MRLALRLLLHPADVEAGEVAHRERPHREAEVVEHAVDVPRHRAFQHQLLRLALALRQHAVADEAGAHADQHRDLADLLGELHRGGDDFLRGLVAAHDLQQLHDVGRREEVQADDVFRPLGHRGDLVDVRGRRCWWRGSRPACTMRVELGEDVLLDVHALEHRLDHEVAVGLRAFDVERAA